MIRTRNRLWVLLKSPAFVMLMTSLVLLLFNVLFIGKYRPFNSDDLYWQQAVRTWSPFNHHTLFLGTKDTFVEQVPFYALMEHLFNPSRKLLLFEAGILTMASFICFYLSSLYFIRQLGIKVTYTVLLPFVWLASFGYPLVQNYLNSDWRTFELGFSFLTFLLVAVALNGRIDPLRSVWSKLVSVIAFVFIGLLMYSDPYYVFFTVAPMALFTAALFLIKKISRGKMLVVFAGVALSYIFSKVIALLFIRAGVRIVFDTPSAFVGFDDIVTNIVSSLHGLIIVYGADFFGRPTANIGTLGSMINALLLAIILVSAWRWRKALAITNLRRLSLPKLWMLFFGCMIAFVFGIYTVSSLVTVANYRYFIILIYSSITFLAFVLGLSRNIVARRIIGLLLLAGIAFNLAYTTFGGSTTGQGDVLVNKGNSLNYALIDAIELQGVTKGYASYWQANVNTYLSSNRVTFLPSLCLPNGKSTPFKWLIDGSQFAIRSGTSFYLIDPDIPQPPTCTRQQLEEQFGKPKKVIKVLDKTILIFNYDISSKMQ